MTTTEMYYFFFVKTPSMSLKRVIMILAASFEFFKKRNAEIIERHTDIEEVPSVNLILFDIPIFFFFFLNKYTIYYITIIM